MPHRAPPHRGEPRALYGGRVVVRHQYLPQHLLHHRRSIEHGLRIQSANEQGGSQSLKSESIVSRGHHAHVEYCGPRHQPLRPRAEPPAIFRRRQAHPIYVRSRDGATRELYRAGDSCDEAEIIAWLDSRYVLYRTRRWNTYLGDTRTGRSKNLFPDFEGPRLFDW